MQAEDAARAYDRVAIAMGKPLTQLNFHHSNYSHEMTKLQELGKSVVIASYRREKSNEYRGVCLHKPSNRFMCHIQDDEEKKYIYIGLFDKVKKHQFMLILCSWECLDTLY